LLANQVLYKIINDISEILQAECSVWDSTGKCQTVTSETCLGAVREVQEFLAEADECNYRIGQDVCCFAVEDEGELLYVLAIHKVDEQVKIQGRLCVSQMRLLIQAYKMRTDKNHFYQNLLLDNLLVVDIFNQAKKLGIENDEQRVVFLVEPKNSEEEIVLEMMKGVYLTGTRDFVTSVDERHIVYVKVVEKTEGYRELNETAKAIVNTMNTEAMINVRVSYGTIVSGLKDVSKSYKEATMALDVGRIFYEKDSVLAYNELGIGRLIHQLPYSLCEMFLKEVFAGKALEQFDDETLSTVNHLFANNLNISETARQLYIHRNTLVYRLEKIQKTTGLDVRVFDDALTFKIAMMVSKHMKGAKE